MLEYPIIIVFFLFYVAVRIFLEKKRDWRGLARALVAGAFLVSVLTAVFQGIMSFFIPLFFLSPLRIIFVGPLVEEASKFIAVLEYSRKKKLIDFEKKTALYGYGVGLGLGTVETLILMTTYVGSPVWRLLLRVSLTISMHIIAAVISAYGVGYTSRTGKRFYYSLPFLGIAITIHVLLNYFFYRM